MMVAMRTLGGDDEIDDGTLSVHQEHRIVSPKALAADGIGPEAWPDHEQIIGSG